MLLLEAWRLVTQSQDKNPNETTFIPKGAVHRIENPFNKPVQIVEVQTGSVLKETDIVRYKDIYGRVN